MKPTFLYSSLFVCIALCVFSCQTEKKDSAKNDIAYDSISVDKVYHIDNDTVKPSCSLKIKYLYPVKYRNNDILAKVQSTLNFVFMEDAKYEQLSPVDAVNKYVEDYVENYKRDVKVQFPDWQASGDSEDYYSYSKILDSRILFDNGGLISYQISSMDYKGGANSFTAYKNVVIDLNTGNPVGEQDIFIDDYKSTLNPLLTKKIVEQNKVQNAEELIEFGFWGIEDITSNNNFWVDENGLTYVFNPGDYSAPSLGAITILLPYEELEDILKSESPISSLSGK